MPFEAVFGRFWPFLARFWPLLASSGPPSPPPLVGALRGPVEGFCTGMRFLKRPGVGEERRTLARGLARSQNLVIEIRVVECCLLGGRCRFRLLVLIMGRGV